MKDFDLATELQKYRETNGLTQEQMADKMLIPLPVYKRIENGTLKPSPEEVKKYRTMLHLEKNGPPPPRKWYQSRKWHWVIPILIVAAFIWIAFGTESFVNEKGGPNKVEHSFKADIFIGGIFCAFYWYYWPPEWPFKKKKGKH